MKNNTDLYDVIILGGGTAGLTAGIYAGRSKMKTLLIEKLQYGGQAAITETVQNYPGFEEVSGFELTNKMMEQAKSFDVEMIVSDVTEIDLENDIKSITTKSGVYKSKSVILATGAEPKKLGFDGEEEFKGKGVGYCATCDGFFFRGKDIFVIGGGNSAADEALYLTKFGKKVIMIVRKNELKCVQTLADKVMADPKIEVRFNTELVKVYGDQVLQGAVFKNNLTGEITEYKVDPVDVNFGVFVFIGYIPTTQIFEGKIEMDKNGYIITNENMETNIKGVFAAGDLRQKGLRQLVTATSDGAVAAMQAEKYVSES